MKKTVFVAIVVLVFGAAGSAVAAKVDQNGDEWVGGPSAVGSWYGKAVPVHPETSPFPEVVMTPTFFRDGNVIANDSHEATNPHVTAHGNWQKTSETGMVAVFVWLNVTTTAPNGFAGSFRITLVGDIAKDHPDEMTGTLHAVFFLPDQNPLDPSAAGIDLGVFKIAELRRIRADKFPR